MPDYSLANWTADRRNLWCRPSDRRLIRSRAAIVPPLAPAVAIISPAAAIRRPIHSNSPDGIPSLMSSSSTRASSTLHPRHPAATWQRVRPKMASQWRGHRRRPRASRPKRARSQQRAPPDWKPGRITRSTLELAKFRRRCQPMSNRVKRVAAKSKCSTFKTAKRPATAQIREWRQIPASAPITTASRPSSWNSSRRLCGRRRSSTGWCRKSSNSTFNTASRPRRPRILLPGRQRPSPRRPTAKSSGRLRRRHLLLPLLLLQLQTIRPPLRQPQRIPPTELQPPMFPAGRSSAMSARGVSKTRRPLTATCACTAASWRKTPSAADPADREMAPAVDPAARVAPEVGKNRAKVKKIPILRHFWRRPSLCGPSSKRKSSSAGTIWRPTINRSQPARHRHLLWLRRRRQFHRPSRPSRNNRTPYPFNRPIRRKHPLWWWTSWTRNKEMRSTRFPNRSFPNWSRKVISKVCDPPITILLIPWTEFFICYVTTGSLLALSPVSLHRALEGDMDVNDPGSNEAGASSGLHNLHHHAENFFSTSSSSSSALSDVPLLDESVFHQVLCNQQFKSIVLILKTKKSIQVSAAAASALLSDIGSLDLQSYMEGGSGGSHQQQHGQSSGQYTDLSQYLASSSGDPVNGGSGYQHETSGFQQHNSDGYVYHHQHHESGAGGFSFDPSPSTPLSSLCSPQHYNVQQYHHQADYHSSNSVDTSSGGYHQSMLMPAAPSPYTPSPSPVSPAVTSSAATLPHMQRFQPQQDAVGFYSTSSFSAHNQSSNFMIDCANSVLYNMEQSGGGGGGGWDHAADLTAVATEALPQLMEQEQPSESILKPQGRIKKSRPSRAKKVDEVDVKKRRNNTTASSSSKKFNGKTRLDELDEMLTCARGSGGQYASAMTAHHCVMLNPKRNGAGLYWNLVRDRQVIAPAQVPPSQQTASRQKSRVRVGKDHQCAALPRCKKKEANKEKETAVLCWSGNGPDEEQVARLLAWSRSASLPGPKRSEEQVLAALTQFRGDVQAAKLHLLAQRADAGVQQENWTPEEMAVFHAALLQHGKDFPQVAQHVSQFVFCFLFIIKLLFLGFSLNWMETSYRRKRPASASNSITSGRKCAGLRSTLQLSVAMLSERPHLNLAPLLV